MIEILELVVKLKIMFPKLGISRITATKRKKEAEVRGRKNNNKNDA